MLPPNPAGITLTWSSEHRLQVVPAAAGQEPVGAEELALCGLVSELGSIYALEVVADELAVASAGAALQGRGYTISVGEEGDMITSSAGAWSEVTLSHEVLIARLRACLTWAESTDPTRTPAGVH